MARKTIVREMNRVEGDLEVRIEVDPDTRTVVDAWCVGTMYRGYEQILVGREPADALVITPRICGICSTSHLYAATMAIETAFGCEVAPNGTRIRNLCLMTEAVMNDARHTFLMFAPDFCNPKYRGHADYDQVVAAFEPPFRGALARQTVYNTKQILGIIIAFGGQWPHSTYMMPGGVTTPVDRHRLVDCLALIESYAGWYEQSVLGCTLDRWLEINTVDDFFAWLDGKAEHRNSAVGLFTRFGRSIGLHRTGKGSAHLLSGGCYRDPDRWRPPYATPACLMAGGFYDGERDALEPFAHEKLSEDLSHSWY